jgi:hypothetical protein
MCLSLNRCPNCGRNIGSDDIFCQSCGIELNKKIITESFKNHLRTESDKEQLRVSEYRNYIQIFGIIEIVFGILGLIGGIFLILIGVFSAILISEGDDYMGSMDSMDSSETIGVFVGVLLIIIALLLFAWAIGSLVSGMKLMQYKNSGRVGTMAIGALSLILFPFGTIFGLAVLYILTKPEVEQLFSYKEWKRRIFF